MHIVNNTPDTSINDTIKYQFSTLGYHVTAEQIEEIKAGMGDIEELEKELSDDLMLLITNTSKKAINLKINAVFFAKMLKSMSDIIEQVRMGVMNEVIQAQLKKQAKK